MNGEKKERKKGERDKERERATDLVESKSLALCLVLLSLDAFNLCAERASELVSLHVCTLGCTLLDMTQGQRGDKRRGVCV